MRAFKDGIGGGCGWHVVVWAVIAIFSGALGGCAAAAPAAGQAAVPAVEKSGDALNAGKAESFQPTPWEDASAGVRRAAADLEMTSVQEVDHPDQVKFIYKDQRGQQVVVTVVRRTGKATEIRVDVGMFGEKGMRSLMMRKILDEINGQKLKSSEDENASVHD